MKMPRLRIAIIICLATATLAVHAQEASHSNADTQPQMSNVESYLRNLFAWGPDYQVKAGPATPSVSPQFLEVPVQVTYNGETSSGSLYVSKDGKYMLRGEILDMSADPFADNRSKINLKGSPSRGPANAAVTVVDYSDYECPHCRELYMAMKQIEPKYPQVRFVTKNLPLSQLHPWAMTAAIAAHCAYQQSQDAFWKVHDTIFDSQDLITVDNATDKLVEIIASATGMAPDAARACIAAPESRAAIDSDLAEAKVLSLNSTPTVFVNGRELVGGDPATLQRYLDYELLAIK
jgi:protein-disulfide isomerase